MFTHRFVRSCRVSSRLKGKSSCRRALLRSEASSTRVVFPLFLVAAASAATVSVERSPRASIAEDSDGKAGDAEMEVSRSIYYKAEPTCILTKPGESWSVRIESMPSKRFRWSEADYAPGLDFGFDVQDSRFSLSSGDEEVYALAGSHGGIPFVAVATIGHHTRIRLIPVVGEVGLQSEVCDIEFDRPERGERMVRELVQMGCTVVRRPEGNFAFSIGVQTTLA